MISPFICYSVSFLVVMLVYSLGWSDLYPGLSVALVIFLALTIAINILFHWLYTKKQRVVFRKLEVERLPVVGTTIFIFILWAIEFIYEGGIPLLKILLHLPYNYRLFGVPSLHVFIVTFSSFFTVYLFHLYLSNRSKQVLILFLVNLSAALLIYSRAMLFFNLTGSMVVFLLSLKKLPYGKMAIIIVVLIPMLFLFGVLGSLRVSREAHEPYNNENFMDTGKATETFRQSAIPKEYFWTYIYVTSPLANLQFNVDHWTPPSTTPSSLLWVAVYECLPDFIAKRIVPFHGMAHPKDYRIRTSFNVSTVYSRAYSYSGWGGLIFMSVFSIIFPWSFLRVLNQQSDFFITGWAILCTMYFFQSYDNTFRFTGLSFQLAYPVVLYVTIEKLRLPEKYLYRKK